MKEICLVFACFFIISSDSYGIAVSLSLTYPGCGMYLPKYEYHMNQRAEKILIRSLEDKKYFQHSLYRRLTIKRNSEKGISIQNKSVWVFMECTALANLNLFQHHVSISCYQQSYVRLPLVPPVFSHF